MEYVPANPKATLKKKALSFVASPYSGFPRCLLAQSVDHPHSIDLDGHPSTPPNMRQEKTQNPKDL
jgi:hypothetical protein